MTEEKKYPIAEMFDSFQGEGLFAGTRMFFIRLAGCSVGKKIPEIDRARLRLPIYTEQCTLYDDRTFACDTDYRTKEVLTVPEILKRIPEGVRHVCITGGEPLIHNLSDLLTALADRVLDVHIETSGTIDIREKAYPEWCAARDLQVDGGWIWITVSPKKGVLPQMIELANEIKLLVDENFDIEKVPLMILQHDLCYIQPINGEHTINQENVKRCLDLQKQYPNFRLSMQTHKLWGVR